MKKVLSIVLLLALVLSSVGCAFAAEAYDKTTLANTCWRFSFMGQKTVLHFYDDGTARSSNGQVTGEYKLTKGNYTKAYPIKGGIGSIEGKGATVTGNVTVNKKLTSMKVTNVKAAYKGHEVKAFGTFKLVRVKPVVKKVTAKKVARNTPSTLVMTFGEAVEAYVITSDKAGLVKLAEGKVVNGAATAQITFAKKSNKVYVWPCLCDKNGNIVTKGAKKAKTVYCK